MGDPSHTCIACSGVLTAPLIKLLSNWFHLSLDFACLRVFPHIPLFRVLAEAPTVVGVTGSSSSHGLYSLLGDGRR